MYEHTAKIRKMNLVCDDWRDCLNMTDKPPHYSTLDHQEFGVHQKCRFVLISPIITPHINFLLGTPMMNLIYFHHVRGVS